MPVQGKKVFVIEYSAFISAQIKGVLTKAGATVKSSSNPCKALLEILHWHPDVIISSVDIGEIKGFDLCLILKMMPDHAGIPFIILSSAEAKHIQAQMTSVGADYYIPKDSHIAKNTYNTICEALHEADDEALAGMKLKNAEPVLRAKCVSFLKPLRDFHVVNSRKSWTSFIRSSVNI